MKINHCSDGGPPQMPGGQQFSEFRLSLKPHIEIVVVPALWAVSASSIDLDWNWFVPATDAHHRNAPQGWGETIAPRYVRCKFEHSTAATVGRHRSGVSWAACKTEFRACCDCPRPNLRVLVLPLTALPPSWKSAGAKILGISSGFHKTAIFVSCRR